MGSGSSETDQITEIASEYSDLLERESLDSFFVIDDIGARVAAEEIDERLGRKVLERLEIDPDSVEFE